MSSVVITGAAAVLSPHVTWQSKFPVYLSDQINYPDVIGKRGLQYLSPASKMVLAASAFARENAGLTEIKPERGGVVLGTNMCCLTHATNYDWQALTEGAHAVSPMEGPNLLLNAPAARLGIFHKLTGLNTTLSSGKCSSLDSIEYAVSALTSGEIDICIVGAVESLSKEYVQWFYENNLIQSLENHRLTEGAGILILETMDHALARGAQIYGYIAGSSSTFDPKSLLEQNEFSEASYEMLFDQLCNQTGINCDQISHVYLSDGLKRSGEPKEKTSAYRLFGADVNYVEIFDQFGELYSTTGIIQVMLALHTENDGKHWITNIDWFGNYRSVLVETRTTTKSMLPQDIHLLKVDKSPLRAMRKCSV